ncbi:MAG: radical SAM protein [Archaeoglobus sp.]|nr:radical SAM protein [Archaeoglobus sp.]
MISLTKMLTGKATVSQEITYCNDESFIPERLKTLRKRLAVVVLNLTARCNLRCVHCYANAGKGLENELRTEEIEKLIDELAKMRVPVLLFSGGEPLLREDIFEIASYASKKGVRCSLSTNGTLITEDVADKIRKAGFDYVGVSIDGLKSTNDRFRGKAGAFESAFEGLLNAKEAGLLTGIRFTVTKYNLKDVEGVLDVLVENEIPRFCLYHLVPSGRADFADDISNAERRNLIEWLMKRSVELVDEGHDIEILTVDNPADAIFAYLKLKEEDPEKAEKLLEFVRYRGGDGSGERIANIDMVGDVHPNQFWWDHVCGNIRKESFEDIWLKPRDNLLLKLRMKSKLIRGEKCGICRFKELCGGFRLRALRAGDLWGDDPDCYLSKEEISG